MTFQVGILLCAVISMLAGLEICVWDGVGEGEQEEERRREGFSRNVALKPGHH